MTLDTIPRASSFSLSPSTVSAGSSMTVSIVRHSASFTHRVSYTFGGASAVVASAAGTSATFQLPMSLLHQIPNAISGTGSIRVETYSGGTLIGSAVSQSFTLTAPASVAPSFSLSVSRVDGNVPAGWGVYVQGQSKAAISVENPAGAYGSTIRQYSISGAGYSSSAQHYTTGLLNRTGSQTISATVTDSRGRSTTKLQTITIEPYALPGITAMAVQRCNADGALNDEGTCCRLTYAISVSSVGGRNIHSASYEARVSGQSGWSPLVVLSPGEPWAVLKPGEGSGLGENFSADQSYDIRMTVTDQIGSVARTAVLSTAPTTMDFKRGGKGVAIGKVAETDNLFEVAWNTKIHGNLEATGTIVATGTAGAPIRIPAHSDLNDYRAIGDYYNELNADAETMAGAPFGQAFYLEVRKIRGHRIAADIQLHCGAVLHSVSAKLG